MCAQQILLEFHEHLAAADGLIRVDQHARDPFGDAAHDHDLVGIDVCIVGCDAVAVDQEPMSEPHDADNDAHGDRTVAQPGRPRDHLLLGGRDRDRIGVEREGVIGAHGHE